MNLECAVDVHFTLKKNQSLDLDLHLYMWTQRVKESTQQILEILFLYV